MKTLLAVTFMVAPMVALTVMGQGQGDAPSCAERSAAVSSAYAAMVEDVDAIRPAIMRAREQRLVGLTQARRYDDHAIPVALERRLIAMTQVYNSQKDHAFSGALAPALRIATLCDGSGASGGGARDGGSAALSCRDSAAFTEDTQQACNHAQGIVDALQARRAELLAWPAAFQAAMPRHAPQTPIDNPVSVVFQGDHRGPSTGAAHVSAAHLDADQDS